MYEMMVRSVGCGSGDDGEQKKHQISERRTAETETETAATAFTSAKADGSEDKDLVENPLPSSKRYVSGCMSRASTGIRVTAVSQ